MCTKYKHVHWNKLNYVFAGYPNPFVVQSGKLTKLLVWNMNRQHPKLILIGCD